MRATKYILLMLAAMLCTATGRGQDTVPERPVVGFYGLRAGSVHLHDTYLSPLNYAGWGIRPAYWREQAMRFAPRRWSSRLALDAGFAHTMNPARNASIYRADFAASWAMLRRWRLNCGLTLSVGPMTRLCAGILFSDRNGNNPVSVIADWTIGAAGQAAYRMNLGALPVTWTYRTSFPLIGAFFRPSYGESYYEIYLGNHSGLARCEWPGNFRYWPNEICATLHLGATSLVVGYELTVQSSSASHLVSRYVSHSLVFGIQCAWSALNTRRQPEPDIIMPY